MKYNRLVWIFLSILCVASCDYFLTEAPTTQLSEETLFADEANMEASLVGVYSALTSGDGSYMKAMAEFCAFPSRLITQKDNRTDEQHIQAQMLTLFPNINHNENNYKFFYTSISRCNNFIDAMPGSPVDQRYKDIREGEVRLIRAIQYFALTRYYGDVPLILHAPTNAVEADAPRASYVDVYKQILNDLTLAEGLMRSPDEPVNAFASARPHKWAATAYKAAVYIQIASILEGQDCHFFDITKRPESKPDFTDIGIETPADAWNMALEAAEAVINSGAYSLAPNYADLYKWGLDAPMTYNLKERVMVVQTTSKSNNSYLTHRTSPPNMFLTGKNNSSGRIRPARYVLWRWTEVHGGEVWKVADRKVVNRSGSTKKDNLANLYKSCYDPRYDISYLHTDFVALSDNKTYQVYPSPGDGCTHHSFWDPYFKKYQDPQYTENTSSGQADLYLMRYAGVILNAAEAAASLSNGPEDDYWNRAMNYMEMIHKRARDSKEGSTSPTMANWNATTSKELVNAIMWERIFELHGEGSGTEFFDVRRRGAEWMSEWFSKPYNKFLAMPEQNISNKASEPEYSYFPRTFWGKPLMEDVQQLRASLLFAFPEVEIRNNGAISDSDQNDFYWTSITPTIPATLAEAELNK